MDMSYWSDVLWKPYHEKLITGKEEVASNVSDT